MSMTTKTAVTADGLRDRLDDLRRDLAAAERDLGAAEIVGADTDAAAERVAELHSTIARVEAAATELERRDDEQRAATAAATARAEEEAAYRRMAEWLAAAAEAVRTHEAALSARQRLHALGVPVRDGVLASRLDVQLVHTTRMGVEYARKHDYRLMGGRSLDRLPSADDFERLRARAEALAAGEEEGEL